jgi:putative methionine-R-sulfoxide reductase with GAF domain
MLGFYNVPMPTLTRDYAAIASSLSSAGSREQRMTAVVDALWEAFHNAAYSWVGFYLDRPDAPDDQRLILGPRRDKPACSPIGLHGACGRAMLTKQTLIVRDVKDLGENYIACDPRDRSEIVIPLIDERGTCWGVLDIDSHEVGAFDERDEAGLRLVLAHAGLIRAK